MTSKEIVDEIQGIKWLIDEGPAHVKLTEAQTRLTQLKDAIPIAIDDAIRCFWSEVRKEAETHCDRRVELLGPIETCDDAAMRKNLLDGWSAWLLSKHVVDNRRAAILSPKEAHDE